MYEKLKSFIANDAFFNVLLLVLVGVVSFGLGRQSMAQNNTNIQKSASAGVIFIESGKNDKDLEGGVEKDDLTVVGSRSGTKYHLLDCPGAQQMKKENKIFFDSIELAKAAGYSPAANCPGL